MFDKEGDAFAMETKKSDGTWTKGSKQSGGMKDGIWGVLFYAHLAGILAVVVLFGGGTIQEQSANQNIDYMPYVYAITGCGAFGFVLTGLSVLIMISLAEVLIKVSLIFSVMMSLVLVVIGAMAGQVLIAILNFVFFLIGLWYIYCVWDRIPFATSNLVTSLTAVKSNLGVVTVSFLITVLGFVWIIVWSMAAAGVYAEVCKDENACTEDNLPYGYLFIMLISLYWTQQVLMNIVVVTVAGVVGTWWFSPTEANSCCSSAVSGSFFRSITSSFGSICLGSLIVAIIKALKEIATEARRRGDGNQIILCIAECILGCIQGIIEYFNKWAYIYVGLYGYSYFEAGKNVSQLFHDRGWHAIITDDLVGNALFFVSIVIGLITGCAGFLFTVITDLFGDVEQAGMVLFIVGFMIGLLLSLIVMSVVQSATDTVIVCFADAPAEFQTNHPELSNRMRQTWLSFYPGCM